MLSPVAIRIHTVRACSLKLANSTGPIETWRVAHICAWMLFSIKCHICTMYSKVTGTSLHTPFTSNFCEEFPKNKEALACILTYSLLLCISPPEPVGVIAVKHLQPNQTSKISSVLSAGVIGIVFDELVLKTVVSDAVVNHTEGSSGALYLLDSNGFVVWMSDDQHFQAYSQLFAKLQPIVFADLLNKSVFIVRKFAACGPTPCDLCDEDHIVNTDCLDKTVFSMHKVINILPVNLVSTKSEH